MQYLGIDWGTRNAAWCAIDDHGETSEGAIPASEGGLARLVCALGPDVRGCIEMMSGAVWVRDRLAAAGWEIQIADARKVKAIARRHARPIASTRASWPSSSGATWCRRCGCHRSPIGSCASGCAGARISSGFAPQR